MKVLFVMRHSGYVRNFESTLRLLCDRGHTVQLVFQIAATHQLLDAGDVTEELCDRYPRFSRGVIPVREDAWGYVARELRASLDYLRYVAPPYRHSPKLVARARRDVSAAWLEKIDAGVWSTPLGRIAVTAWLRARHRAIPPDPRIEAFLRAHQPDVLVVTPLIEPGSPQAEYVRSARALGIRTALSVASWDNLTNKGLIHGPVDLVTVWNEMMKREAVELHGVAPERVAVTGAQPFDHWFDWRPSVTREAFCGRVGLPPDNPYVLYLCSSKFIAPEEAPFVRRWIQSLRQSSLPALRQVGVMVRPHPQNADQWAATDLSECGPAVVFPATGAAPADTRTRADYFDSMYHSAAVVGVNTTAEIESAIVGRRVFTVLAPEFRDTQEGTPHFEHLRSVNGGLLHVAADADDHLSQLDAALRDPQVDDGRCRRFVDAFVRPYGLDVPATPKLVAALEQLAAAPAPMPVRADWWAGVIRASLAERGERLQCEALLDREVKAEKKARRVRKLRRQRAEAPLPQAEEPRMPRSAKAPRTWKELAVAYRGLDARDRLRFGRATIESLPGELQSETVRAERLDYPDAEILLRVSCKAERNRLKACAKEPFTIDWIHQHVRPGDVLYDIGANVGAYSLVAAKKPGGGARVFSFEPSYANVAALCANIVLNQAAESVTPMPYALSDTDALTVFGLRALDPGSARHTLGAGPSSEGPALYRQPVMTFRLDELVERFGLPRPNHIKLDVDGGELAVLEGARRTLGSPSLRSMLVEVSTSLSDTITEGLLAQGLQLQSRVRVKNKAGEYLVWYGLFARGPLGGPAHQDVREQVLSR